MRLFTATTHLNACNVCTFGARQVPTYLVINKLSAHTIVLTLSTVISFLPKFGDQLFIMFDRNVIVVKACTSSLHEGFMYC